MNGVHTHKIITTTTTVTQSGMGCFTFSKFQYFFSWGWGWGGGGKGWQNNFQLRLEIWSRENTTRTEFSFYRLIHEIQNERETYTRTNEHTHRTDHVT